VNVTQKNQKWEIYSDACVKNYNSKNECLWKFIQTHGKECV
jgi:hypothetical protein